MAHQPIGLCNVKAILLEKKSSSTIQPIGGRIRELLLFLGVFDQNWT